MSHHGRAAPRALASTAAVFGVGFGILSVVFLSGLLHELLALLLPPLLLFGSVVWGVRSYFVARAEIKSGITVECSGSERTAVLFAGRQSGGWRFRFFNRAYAERFAAANVGATLTGFVT